MDALVRPVVFVRCFGCTYDNIPPHNDGFFSWMEADNIKLNSLTHIPDLSDIENACRHILTFIEPPKFHAINVVYNFLDVAIIKTIADADPSSSFIFVGSIPDEYRAILSGRMVRVATRFDDLEELFSGILSALKSAFEGAFLKEYTDANLNEGDASNALNSQFSKYAERFYQSGKDLFKIIQTAAGPIPLPTPFRRSSLSNREDEAKKLSMDGILCLLLKIDCTDAILKRLQKSKVSTGLYSEFELLYALRKEEAISKIGIPMNALETLRTVAMAVFSGHSEALDWKLLLENYLRLDFACKLAIFGTNGEAVKERHFYALFSIVHHRVYNSIKWRTENVPFNLPSIISTLPNELVTIKLDNIGEVFNVTCSDAALCITRSELIGTKFFLEFESHLCSSRVVLFILHSHSSQTEWKVLFDVDPLQGSQIVRYKRGQGYILHIRTQLSFASIEFDSDGTESRIKTEPKEREWLLHIPLQKIQCVRIITADNKRLNWSAKFIADAVG